MNTLAVPLGGGIARPMMAEKAPYPMAQDPRSLQHRPRIGWLTTLVKLIRGLFVAQVRLERREGQLHVVLHDSKAKAASSPPNATMPPMGVDAAQLQRMRTALAQVLDQHAGARKVLRHLGYLEHALGRKGAQCLLDLPVEVLKPALLQLASVMTPGSSQGLTELHACLVVLVVERDMAVEDVAQDDSGRLSVFNDKVQVREISHSDFVNADHEWSLPEETTS